MATCESQPGGAGIDTETIEWFEKKQAITCTNAAAARSGFRADQKARQGGPKYPPGGPRKLRVALEAAWRKPLGAPAWRLASSFGWRHGAIR